MYPKSFRTEMEIRKIDPWTGIDRFSMPGNESAIELTGSTGS
jgi:hypothetical protein